MNFISSKFKSVGIGFPDASKASLPETLIEGAAVGAAAVPSSPTLYSIGGFQIRSK
jgi:hypothetical protein